MKEARLGDREVDRTSAALMTCMLLVGLVSGATIAIIGLRVADSPWPTAAAGLLLLALAYLCRDRRWITALFLGAGLSILFAWVVVVGGGHLVSQF